MGWIRLQHPCVQRIGILQFAGLVSLQGIL
jgi:hypothetical protein